MSPASSRPERASRLQAVLALASLPLVGSLLLPACSSEEDCERRLTCAPAGGSATGSGPGGGGQSEDGGSGGGGEAGGGASGGRASAGGTSGGGPGGIGGETQGCGMGCAGAAAYCDEEAGACMECRKDEDCGEQLCDVALGECVECKESAHCTDARAPACEEGECVGCEQPGDCTHLPATPACEPTTGECVQCMNAADCGGKVCDPVSHTCSEYGSDRLPCESCDSDANCETVDHYCVPMNYQDQARGGYCLKAEGPGCVEPFRTLIANRTSLSGVEGQEYCGISEELVTCEAVRSLIDNVPCSSGMDAQCPESGLCRNVGGSLSKYCTYRCDGATDCKATGAGSTCGPSPDNFCGFKP